MINNIINTFSKDSEPESSKEESVKPDEPEFFSTIRPEDLPEEPSNSFLLRSDKTPPRNGHVRYIFSSFSTSNINNLIFLFDFS